MPQGYLGFSMVQRKWAVLSLNQDLEVLPHRFDERKDYIGSMVLHIDFYNKKKVTQEPYNTDEMAKEFLMEFHNQGERDIVSCKGHGHFLLQSCSQNNSDNSTLFTWAPEGRSAKRGGSEGGGQLPLA
jgi:hypothetical protein